MSPYYAHSMDLAIGLVNWPSKVIHNKLSHFQNDGRVF